MKPSTTKSTKINQAVPMLTTQLIRKLILGCFYVSILGCLLAYALGYSAAGGWCFVSTLGFLVLLGWLYRWS